MIPWLIDRRALHGNGRPGRDLPTCGYQRLGPVQIAGSANVKEGQEVWVYSGDVLFRTVLHSDILVESGYFQVVGLQSLFDVWQALLEYSAWVGSGRPFNTGTTASYPSRSEFRYVSSSELSKGMPQATTRPL